MDTGVCVEVSFRKFRRVGPSHFQGSSSWVRCQPLCQKPGPNVQGLLFMLIYCLSLIIPAFQTFEEALPHLDDPASALILALYNRHVQSYRDIYDRIKTHVDGAYNTELNRYLKKLFKRRLRRYLQGSGHPDHPDIISGALVSHEDRALVYNDPLFCARMFLRSITTSDRLPMDSDWEIKVSSMLTFFWLNVLIMIH